MITGPGPGNQTKYAGRVKVNWYRETSEGLPYLKAAILAMGFTEQQVSNGIDTDWLLNKRIYARIYKKGDYFNMAGERGVEEIGAPTNAPNPAFVQNAPPPAGLQQPQWNQQLQQPALQQQQFAPQPQQTTPQLQPQPQQFAPPPGWNGGQQQWAPNAPLPAPLPPPTGPTTTQS